jgi:hypothetical protein
MPPLVKDHAALVPAPAPSSVNTNSSPGRFSSKVEMFGRPASGLTQKCQDSKAPALVKKWMVTRQCGRFKIRGFVWWVDIVELALELCAQNHPELYARLHYAGTFCVRKIRGGSTISSHGFAIASDWGIDGHIDPRGDGRVQVGLLKLYACFKEACRRLGVPPIYWGIEFPTEDGMHFEASEELIRFWLRKIRKGILPVAS